MAETNTEDKKEQVKEGILLGGGEGEPDVLEKSYGETLYDNFLENNKSLWFKFNGLLMFFSVGLGVGTELVLQ